MKSSPIITTAIYPFLLTNKSNITLHAIVTLHWNEISNLHRYKFITFNTTKQPCKVYNATQNINSAHQGWLLKSIYIIDYKLIWVVFSYDRKSLPGLLVYIFICFYLPLLGSISLADQVTFSIQVLLLLVTHHMLVCTSSYWARLAGSAQITLQN